MKVKQEDKRICKQEDKRKEIEIYYRELYKEMQCECDRKVKEEFLFSITVGSCEEKQSYVKDILLGQNY